MENSYLDTVMKLAEITLQNVTHAYIEEYYAVNDVNLKIDDGAFIALLGPSGCGKTTLMRIISGLLKPSKGKVFFNGKEVTDWTPEERNTAMVFQTPIVYNMTVYDNLAFPLRNMKVPENEVRSRIERISEILDIENYLHQKAPKLNPGIQQKVALGRALIREPNVYLLDEPLSSIEPKERLDIKTKLKELQKELKITAIYVTHDQSEALTLGEKVAVMNFGKILQYGTPLEVYNYPATDFVAFFIGDPGMNLYPCTLVGDQIDIDGLKYDASNFKESIEKQGNKFIFGIRPENVQISKEKTANSYLSRVILVENLGVARVIHVEVGSLRIKAKTEDTFPIQRGDSLYINFPRDSIRIFSETGELLI